ncbi:rhodanese-like domain-containing protein [bacterium]
MTFIWILIIIFVLFILFQKRGAQLHIPAVDLKNRLDQKEPLILIDVRNPDEYHGPQGHIENAVLNPISQISSWADTLKESSNTIILICHVGNRSLAAARYLSSRGISAYNLKGGMTAWHQHGFPVK